MSKPPCPVRLTTSTTSARIKPLHYPPRTVCWCVESVRIAVNGRSLSAVELERNPTRLHCKQPKRAYYLCIEYLMGRTFDNALLNLGLKDKYHEGINKLGFNLEDLIKQERDAALGNGGLG